MPTAHSNIAEPTARPPSVRLRQWQASDLPLFAAMNADPQVMEFFLRPLSEEESAAAMQRMRTEIDERGWGGWAVEVDGEFAGLTGITRPRFEASFTPCVGIGWRLRRRFWGQGIALNAARQAMDYAFHTLRLPELVSFTAALNLRSQRLMQRLGFTRDPAHDFNHPHLPAGHPLTPHVLYRKKNPEG